MHIKEYNLHVNACFKYFHPFLLPTTSCDLFVFSFIDFCGFSSIKLRCRSKIRASTRSISDLFGSKEHQLLVFLLMNINFY